MRPGVQHHDLVGHRHGLDLIVRNVDGGGPELLLQFGDFQAHLDAERRVEVRQGLVEQKCLRLAHDGAPDRDALALPAGKVARLAIKIGRQVQRGGGGSTLRSISGRGRPAIFRPNAMLPRTLMCG